MFFVSEPLPAREIVSRLEGRPSMLPLLSFSTAFSPSLFLSRMQVTARFWCHNLHSRVFPCLLQSSTVSLHTAYQVVNMHPLVSWMLINEVSVAHVIQTCLLTEQRYILLTHSLFVVLTKQKAIAITMTGFPAPCPDFIYSCACKKSVVHVRASIRFIARALSASIIEL